MEKKMKDMNIKEILDLTAGDAPAPGGGAISAIAGALGSALGRMVLSLSYGKKAFLALDEEIQEKLKEKHEELDLLGDRLFDLMDTDVEAFMGYMRAFRLPKESDEEKTARREAIDEAAVFSMQVPLETAERCVAVLNCLPLIAEYGNKNAITDVGVASLLARAACESALLNVRINLPTIKDEAIHNKAAKRTKELLSRAKELNEEIMKVVYAKLG